MTDENKTKQIKEWINEYEKAYKNEDYESAMTWLKKAVDAGDAYAMCEIGGMYLEGYGVEKDCDKGLEWIHKATENGSVDAMVALGTLYLTGDNGVEQNYEKGIEYLEKAAMWGNVDAM